MKSWTMACKSSVSALASGVGCAGDSHCLLRLRKKLFTFESSLLCCKHYGGRCTLVLYAVSMLLLVREPSSGCVLVDTYLVLE